VTLWFINHVYLMLAAGIGLGILVGYLSKSFWIGAAVGFVCVLIIYWNWYWLMVSVIGRYER
jgi:hypothetical protein